MNLKYTELTVCGYSPINRIVRIGEETSGKECLFYEVEPDIPHPPVFRIPFQAGSREDAGSYTGVTNCDLLEIVADRLEYSPPGDISLKRIASAVEHIRSAIELLT